MKGEMKMELCLRSPFQSRFIGLLRSFLGVPRRYTGLQLTSSNRGYLCSRRSLTECMDKGTVVTAVTTFWRGTQPILGTHARPGWCVCGASQRGCRRFVVTAVTVVIAPTLRHPTKLLLVRTADITETYCLPVDEETDLSIGLCQGGSTTRTL